jgi:hypothetical protein
MVHERKRKRSGQQLLTAGLHVNVENLYIFQESIIFDPGRRPLKTIVKSGQLCRCLVFGLNVFYDVKNRTRIFNDDELKL